MRPKIRSGSTDAALAAAQHNPSTRQSPAQVTPSEKFFTQPVAHRPAINRDYWSLMLAGQVELPRIVTYSDLLALPQTELACTLACGGHQPGGDMIGHAYWRGVRFTDLLQQVTLKPQAAYAHFYAADGYVTSLPLNRLSSALIAYQMNGEALAPQHGYPARLIAPGLYGYKLPRWLRRIELAAQPLAGFWEKRGWPMGGEAHTTISVTSPQQQSRTQPIEISGIAYGGIKQLLRIEVSIDDGPWMPVPFTPQTAFSWAPWSIDWFAGAPGSYRVAARAVNVIDQSATHTTIFHIQ